MLDYFGGMERFKRKFDDAGVPEEFANIYDYVGLTRPELIVAVDSAIARWEKQKDTYVVPKVIKKFVPDDGSYLVFSGKCGGIYEYKPKLWTELEIMTDDVIRVKGRFDDVPWRMYKVKCGTVSINGEVVA